MAGNWVNPHPPLEHFLHYHLLSPSKAGTVLVPGCGRGHEAALLTELGYEVVGLDFSTEAIKEARLLSGPDRPQLRWLCADLFAPAALIAAGLDEESFDGVVEHTCFCAIDPALREAYRRHGHNPVQTRWLAARSLFLPQPARRPALRQRSLSTSGGVA
jgi:thiopurine S-methyltransferase